MLPLPQARNRDGFTLIEVMMAVMIMSLVFVSSIAALTIGYRMLEDARMSTLASQVLQSEMENLRLKNWSQISALPASEPFTIDTTLNTTSFQKFTCTRQITDIRTDLKQITLVVQWNAMDGKSRVRRYLTYMGENGLNDYYYRKF